MHRYRTASMAVIPHTTSEHAFNTAPEGSVASAEYSASLPEAAVLFKGGLPPESDSLLPYILCCRLHPCYLIWYRFTTQGSGDSGHSYLDQHLRNSGKLCHPSGKQNQLPHPTSLPEKLGNMGEPFTASLPCPQVVL